MVRPIGTLLRPKHHSLVTILSGAGLALHVAVAGIVLGLSRQRLHVVRLLGTLHMPVPHPFECLMRWPGWVQMDQIRAHLVLGVSSIVWCAPMA